MAQESLVFYASPGMGHFGSMVEFAKLIVTDHPNFSITILFNTLPTVPKSSFDPLIASVAASTPSITFHHLQSLPTAPSSSFLDLSFELPRLSCPEISNMLKTMSSSQTKPRAFFLDFFCNAAFEVAKSLDIPTYYYYVSGACGLAAFLSLPAAHRAAEASQDTRMVLNLPGLPPFPLSHYPDLSLGENLRGLFKSASINMAKSSGIVANTFRALDQRTLQGLRVPDGPTPPIYCIGPLVVGAIGRTPGGHECLRWLDSQPTKSVIFLCFGSLGVFSGKQLKEMAIGLESSGHRFLWVVRNPPDEDKIELEEVFPSGFLERTKERGLVVRNWAPQVAVLGHDSVGGFVTHFGWNSILEAICAGVPMLAWPLYADSKFSRDTLVGVMGLALRLNQEEEDGFVSAAELEKRVRELMDSDSNIGKEVRERVCAMKQAGEAALSAGGSSRLELNQLVQSFK